jgi:hypothetical protein
VYPNPARETAPGFSLRERGAPQKRLGFFGAPTPGAPNASVFWPPPPRTPNRKTSRGVEENAPISERPKRKSGRPAAGLAQPRDEHGAEPARFVEALNTPVVTPVMCLFGGRRDSLFINPFKKVTKPPCKFHLLQGACSCPVVYRVTGPRQQRHNARVSGRNTAWTQRLRPHRQLANSQTSS